MLIRKKKTILAILLILSAFTMLKESILEESGITGNETETEETEWEEKSDELAHKVNITNKWAGSYVHFGESPLGGVLIWICLFILRKKNVLVI